jgi:hypothetical protein
MGSSYQQMIEDDYCKSHLFCVFDALVEISAGLVRRFLIQQEFPLTISTYRSTFA